MAFVAAADPASKSAYVFTEVGQLHEAIKLYGFIPLAPDGSQMRVQEFQGGYLLNGAPINVWMGQGWFTGQQEALQPYWTSGQVPRPPNEVMNAETFEMPADVAENYNKYMASQSPLAFLGGNTGMIVAVLAAGAALWYFSGSSKGSGGDGAESYI